MGQLMVWAATGLCLCFGLIWSPLALSAQVPFLRERDRVYNPLFFPSRGTGQAYNPKSHYHETKAQLLHGWRQNPQDEKLVFALSRTYLYGMKKGYIEDTMEATEWYQLVISSDPTAKTAFYASAYLEKLYTWQNKPEKAIQVFEGLLEYTQPKEHQTYYLYTLSSLYVQQENVTAALAYARRWAELVPDAPHTQEKIEQLTQKKLKNEPLLKELNRTLNVKPVDHEKLRQIAESLKEQGFFRKAFEVYIRLNADTPDNFLYLDRLFKLGDNLNKDKGFRITILTQMLTLQPQNVRIISLLAEETGSEDLIKRGLELEPNNRSLQFLKDKLQFQKALTEGRLML